MKVPGFFKSFPVRQLLTVMCALVVSTASAHAGTRILSSPPPARQAKIATAILTAEVTHILSTGDPEVTQTTPVGRVLPTQSLYFIGTEPVWDNRFTFMSDRGAGYGDFINGYDIVPDPSVIFVSAEGTGAVGIVSETIYGNIEDNLIIGGGSNYLDDVTAVITPPRTNDLQAVLDDASVDTIELSAGVYFQNAVISHDVTIRGQGQGRTFISGGLLGSVIHVQPGKTLHLVNLTLFDGLAPSGGGIYNDGGVVFVDHCEIRNCRAYGSGGQGGGIFNRGTAILTLTDSFLHNNIAAHEGGGISSSGINTSLLPAVAGAIETPANSLSRFYSELSTMQPPDTSASIEDQFNAAWDQFDGIMQGFAGFGSATNIFTSIGPDLFGSNSNWNAFGLPVTLITNTIISNNQAGKGNGTATVTENDCTEVLDFVGGSAQENCDYYSSTHSIRLLAWGAGIHNELGLVILDHATVTQNTTSTDFGSLGGGLSSFFGVVMASQSTIANNSVQSSTILASGGAVHSFASIVEIADSALTNNAVNALFLSSGGAIKSTALTFLDVERTPMIGNTSGGGGAVANDYLSLGYISNCNMSSNTVSGVVGANGGGVRNEVGGNVFLTDCTLSYNSASGLAHGGGLYNQCETNRVVRISTATLVNCTVSGNSLDGTGKFGIPLEAYGAGLYNGSAQDGIANLFVTSCTIVSNTASGGLIGPFGGGYYNSALSNIKLNVTDIRRGTSLVQLANNLFAGNSPHDCFNNFLTISALTVSLGYNLDTDGSGAVAAFPSDELLGPAGFLKVTNALLSPLQFNGGYTPTHALLPGSPAIDQGSTPGTAAEAASLSTDQRGVDRSLGGRRDIGALETVAPIGAPDSFTAIENQPLVVSAPGVLVKDIATAARAVQVSSPANGTLQLQANGGFTYTPATGFNGTDSFIYQAVDASGASTSNLTVTITVSPRLNLLSVVPAAGSLAQRNDNVVLTFDSPVTVDAINQAVALIGSQSGAHDFTVSSNGNVVTLAPQPDFARGEQVTVSISPELQSAAGWPIWPAPSDIVYAIFTNRAPVLGPDTYTMLEGTVLQVSAANSLLSNDSDPDGDPFFVSDIAWRATLGELIQLFGWSQNFTFESNSWVFVQPVPVTNSGPGGTLSVGADGTFVFQPSNYFSGVFTFDYHATDSLGAISAPSTVTINVTHVNHPPVASNDFYSIYTRSIPRLLGVLANDIDVDNDPLTAILDTPTSHGSITLNPDGSFVYTPVVGYYGPDVFTYHDYDGHSSSASARVKFGNTPPVAVPDAYPATAGQTLSVTATNGVLVNDTDADGDPLTAQLVTPPSYGSLTFNPDGSFIYAPNATFAGGDIFTYQASDGLTNSVPVRVKLGNLAPIAQNDSGYNALTGRPLVVTGAGSVLANDSDLDGDPLTAVLVTGPSHGMVSLNPDGTFTYISAIGFEGNDSFTYSANDGSLNSTPATVSIHVSDILRVLSQTPARNSETGASNDPVVVNFNFPIDPTSISGKFIIYGSMSGRHSFSSTVNGAQVTLNPLTGFESGEVVTVSALSGIHGTGNAVLDPSYLWQYVVAATRGGTNFVLGSAPDTTPHRNSSVALGDLNGDGYPDAVVISQDSYPVVLLNNRDRTFTARSEPLGTTSPQTSLMQKTVLADFNGDGYLDMIGGGNAPDPIFGLNRIYVRVGLNDGTGHFPTTKDLPLTDGNQTHLPNIMAAGDFDGDGDIDLVAFDSTTGWLLRNDGTGGFSFSPSNYISTAGIFVQNVAVGDANGDGKLDLFISGFGGTAVLLNDGTGHFTPSFTNLVANSDPLTTVADFQGDSTLDVGLVPGFLNNIGILTNDGAGNFSAGEQNLGNESATAIAAGDLDGDGAPDLWLTTGSGSILWLNNGTGHFSKVPFNVGTNLTRGVAFADFDRDGDLDAFLIGDANVSALNQVWFNQSPPKARDDFYAANGNAPVTVLAPGVLANDTAGDGGAMTAVLDSQPSHGTVVLNSDGSFTYTPGTNFTGADVFTYHAHDSLADSTSARVKIGNTAPTAQPDGPYTIAGGSPFVLAAPGVLANDSDAENDPLKAILVSTPTNGTVALKADGSFVYVPFNGYHGPDAFTYQASDGIATSSAVTVSLDIHNPLILTSIQPATNAVSIPLDTDFELSFNHPLSAASIPGNVFLYSAETGPKPFAYSLAGNTLTISANTSFRTGEKVTLTLGAALEGANSELQNTPLVLSFTAEAPLGEGAFVEGSQQIGDTNYNVPLVLFGDLNGDGFVDAFIPGGAITITNSAPARVWFNDGTGHFVDSGQQLAAGFSFGGALVDVNGDGFLDAVLPTTAAPGASLWLNDGTGHFTQDPQTFGNDGVDTVLAGDLNGDGAIDLVAVGGTNMTVWLNDGQGHFTASAASFANVDFFDTSLFNVGLADVDGDGHLDIVIRQFSSPFRILLNDGHAVFHDSGYTFGTGGSGLAIGDVNGDGYPDIIAPAAPSITGTPGHFLYLNDGTGHFIEHTQTFNTFHTTDVKLADVNGDGYLDAIVLQDSSSLSFSGVTNLSRVYFNDGQGNFTPSTTILGNFATNSSGNVLAGSGVTVTDLDNDKDLDLVFAQAFRGPIQFWFNQSVLGPIKGLGLNFVINDNQTTTPFSNAQINAPASSSLTVSVTLDDAAKGVFTPASLVAGGFTGPTNGTYTLSGASAAAAQAAIRQLVFAPTPNRVPVGGTEVTHFTVSVTDGTTTRQDSSTTVTAVSVNFPPVAVDDRGPGFTTVDNAPFTTTNVLANDSDPDGDTFVISAVDTSQTVGLVTSNGDGTFNYDPNGHFISLPVGAIGTDSFRYTIRDNYGAESTATVTITIIGINEPPVARDVTLTITQGSGPNLITSQVLANDSDPDTGDQAGFVITSVDTTGTLGTVRLAAGNILTYDPITTPNLPLGGIGSDSFRYTLSDNHGGFASATVHITLMGINHPPVAGPDFLAMLANAPLQDITSNLLANAFDPDPGETASLTIVSLDSLSTNHVLLLTTNAHVFYQPTNFEYLGPGLMATDTFNYVIQDIHGAIATGEVSVAITGVIEPPTAVPDYLVFHQGDPQRDITTNILANDFDFDGSTSNLVITAVVAGPNPKGTLTFLNGRVTYQPSLSPILANQQVVTDSFTYTISDAFGATNSTTDTIYVIGVNSPPVANAAAFSVNNNQMLNGAVTGSDPDGDSLTFALGVGPTNGTLTLNTNGTFSYLPATNYYGPDSFTFKANDGLVDSPLATVSITVIPITIPPILASTPASVSVQYSDPIPVTTVTATDVDSPGATLLATTAWQTNGGPFQVGLPGGLTFAQATTTTNARSWTVSGLPKLGPGNYLIRVAVGDGQGVTNSLGVPLLVGPEDARVTFTGNPFVTTTSASSNGATVTLSATIQDISAVPTDPATDPTPGDIRNAKVAFVNRANNSLIVSNLPVGLVSSSDPKTGTATWQWNVNLGTNNSQTFTVGIVVGGFYTRNASTDDTVITVTRPLSGSFASGSGFLVLSRPAGLLTADVGSKTDFGFSATNTSTGIQGSMSLVIRGAGHVYQINALQLTALSIKGNHATLNGVAQVMDSKSPTLLDDDATFQLQFTDNGNPGSNDTLAVTVWNDEGGLWFASDWDGTKTLEQKLAGGNIVVGPTSGTKSTLVAEVDTEPLGLSLLLLPASEGKPARCQLQFPVVADTDHVVEYSSDLQNWSQLKTVRSSTDQSYVLEEELTSGPRFYRVLRQSSSVPVGKNPVLQSNR